jgi:hypothetical protein
MSATPQQMSVDDFLLWAEGQEGRWELHDGVAKRITSERLDQSGRKERRASRCA